MPKSEDALLAEGEASGLRNNFAPAMPQVPNAGLVKRKAKCILTEGKNQPVMHQPTRNTATWDLTLTGATHVATPNGTDTTHK